ncbi:hypothetical protein SCAR479_08702 [Seiridium cardinale]|uniref:Uncharacterized protein n=1 Tax=Seiridium cardinale TaxID=138064 RepID=A0ABR2XLJ5_9PEZI
MSTTRDGNGRANARYDEGGTAHVTHKREDIPNLTAENNRDEVKDSRHLMLIACPSKGYEPGQLPSWSSARRLWDDLSQHEALYRPQVGAKICSEISPTPTQHEARGYLPLPARDAPKTPAPGLNPLEDPCATPDGTPTPRGFNSTTQYWSCVTRAALGNCLRDRLSAAAWYGR